LEGIFTFCDRPRRLADEECEMENMNGKYQPPLMLLCATMGLAVSVSLCFAQGNREAQIATAPPEITTPFKCDSLDPEVCFDIYRRILQKSAPPTASRALNWSTKLEYLHYGPPFGTAPLYYGLGTPNPFFGTVPSGWPGTVPLNAFRSNAWLFGTVPSGWLGATVPSGWLGSFRN
jgi:hypothetical protein